MVKIVWTEPALQDLEDIGDYIAKDSERYFNCSSFRKTTKNAKNFQK